MRHARGGTYEVNVVYRKVRVARAQKNEAKMSFHD
jgi:hypothetical protein